MKTCVLPPPSIYVLQHLTFHLGSLFTLWENRKRNDWRIGEIIGHIRSQWNACLWSVFFGLRKPREFSSLSTGCISFRHKTVKRPGAGIMEADDVSDDSLHSATVIPPSALDKPSIMKRYHRRRMCSHNSPRRSPTMVALHDTRFV